MSALDDIPSDKLEILVQAGVAHDIKEFRCFLGSGAVEFQIKRYPATVAEELALRMGVACKERRIDGVLVWQVDAPQGRFDFEYSAMGRYYMAFSPAA